MKPPKLYTIFSKKKCTTLGGAYLKSNCMSCPGHLLCASIDPLILKVRFFKR